MEKTKSEIVNETIEEIDQLKLQFSNMTGVLYNTLDFSYLTLVSDCLDDKNDNILKGKVIKFFKYLQEDYVEDIKERYPDLSVLTKIAQRIYILSTNYEGIDEETTSIVRDKLDEVATLIRYYIIDTMSL